MKIRNGFVSNSSSSSFMIIVKKEPFDEFYNSLEPYQKDIVNHRLQWDEFYGEKVALLSGYDEYGETDLDGMVEDEVFISKIDDEEDKNDFLDHQFDCVWDRIQEKLPEGYLLNNSDG